MYVVTFAILSFLVTFHVNFFPQDVKFSRTLATTPP
jgi:hypothetical protein